MTKQPTKTPLSLGWPFLLLNFTFFVVLFASADKITNRYKVQSPSTSCLVRSFYLSLPPPSLHPYVDMESTIQFADTPKPKRSHDDLTIGGVVPLRARSRSRGRKSSFEIFKSGEVEDAEDEDAGLRNEGDYKHKQVGKCRLPTWKTVT